MKKVVYILFLGFFLSSCASKAVVEKIKKDQSNLPLSDASCFIDGQVFQEKNLKHISDDDNTTYLMRAEDGKNLALPMDKCLLQSQGVSYIESSFKLSEKEHAVRCEIGPISFVSKNLKYVADEKGYFRLRNDQNTEWSLPRTSCKIFLMEGL